MGRGWSTVASQLSGSSLCSRLRMISRRERECIQYLGGLVMYVLGRIPAVTDHFDAAGYRFEVVDMDKNRVDKMLLTQLLGSTEESEHSAD